jgi:hypothetical protein
MATVIWHGTRNERRDLSRAVHHNCTCEFGLMGVRLSTCASHHMLYEDQRALDGLLFGRRIARRLGHEEGLDIYRRSRGLPPDLKDDGRPRLGNALWGWASVALGQEMREFNPSR